MNPRIWIKKCYRYFLLCKIPDDQKVDFASLYMIDKAEGWVSSYLTVCKSVDWDDFLIDLVACFKDDFGVHVVEQFNQLQQSGSLESYIGDFEHLKSLMLEYNHVLPIYMSWIVLLGV
ncbi:UDP-N-acetylmuramate--L-alanine ligase [Bienertia sinuspersici]